MKLKFTAKDGSILKFTSLDQAAKYMSYFKKSVSTSAARQNIQKTLDGHQIAGNHQGGSSDFNRNSAYGYSIEVIK